MSSVQEFYEQCGVVHGPSCRVCNLPEPQKSRLLNLKKLIEHKLRYNKNPEIRRMYLHNQAKQVIESFKEKV